MENMYVVHHATTMIIYQPIISGNFSNENTCNI